MTPKEQQKADAWMLLNDGNLVTERILNTMQLVLGKPEIGRWMSMRLVDAEKTGGYGPLKMYFEAQLERNLRLILAEGVQTRLEEIVRPMIDEAVKRHAEQISQDLAELKKLKSKGPIGRR